MRPVKRSQREPWSVSDAHTFLIAISMQNEIRVLRVFCYILLNRWTNNVNLEVVLAGPTESGFC